MSTRRGFLSSLLAAPLAAPAVAKAMAEEKPMPDFTNIPGEPVYLNIVSSASFSPQTIRFAPQGKERMRITEDGVFVSDNAGWWRKV